jgi:hypothetical protein
MMVRFALLMLLLLVGCGGDETETTDNDPPDPPEACEAPSRTVDGVCLEPGIQDDGCAAGSIMVDGACRPAGIVDCGEGFEAAAEGGCAPVGAMACPSGQMALPGDTACREVMVCASGTWGDIPLETDTVFVDQSFVGTSDGGQAQPFVTIQEGVDAVSDGAIVAVAAGTYVEDVVVVNKQVRLWGSCTSQVQVTGTGVGFNTLGIREDSSGSEVHNMSFSGRTGIFISGSIDVVVEQVRVHAALARGFVIQDQLGETDATIRQSLIDDNGDMGVFISAATVTLESVVIRNTAPLPDLTFGRGLNAQDDPVTATRAALTMINAIVEGNREVGVFLEGCDGNLDRIVVRDNLPREIDQIGGRGINIQVNPASSERSDVDLRHAFVRGNHDNGVLIVGSDARIESLTVIDTLPVAADQTAGRGLGIQNHVASASRPQISAFGIFIRNNYEQGIFTAGVDATFESIVVLDTLPHQLDQMHGRGIAIQDHPGTGERGNVSIAGSLISDNYDVGVFVVDSDATLVGVAVVNTLPRVFDGAFGDGITIARTVSDTNAFISASRSEQSARAGLSIFSAETTLGGTLIQCNAIQLAAEDILGIAPQFTDGGFNQCTCNEIDDECKALSVGLAPPTPLAPSE